MTEQINTHGLVCDFGKHKGTLYTRLPVGYLHWMVNGRHSHADIAKAELGRRGTVRPELDVSGHAIDRASLHCRKIWHETANKDEGLYSWLCRMAAEAIGSGAERPDKKFLYRGMIFVFETETEWPVLKTVMRDG